MYPKLLRSGIAFWVVVFFSVTVSSSALALNLGVPSLGQACNSDADCDRGGVNSVDQRCLRGKCTAVGLVRCVSDSQCPSGNICTSPSSGLGAQCMPGCRKDSDCGRKQVCNRANRQCTNVQCTRDSDCGSQSRCDNNNICRSRCPSGQRWVTTGTIPVCGACVTSKPARIVRGPADCPPGKVFAGGYCINRCAGVRGAPGKPGNLNMPGMRGATPFTK